jgi:N-carbamoylputrescine amidase
MNSLRVALIQAAPGPPNPEENVIRGDALCRRAKALNADIALFPEMWSIGYDIHLTDLENWESLAEPQDGAFVKHFAALAQELEMAIAISYLEASTEGPRNSTTLLDSNGDALFTYSKVHLCRWDQPEGSLVAGENFPVATLMTSGGPVQVGAMICFDREFPESARILMLQGAEIILTPNACHLDEHRLVQFRTRAYENMVGVAMANYSASPNRNENGHSVAYSPVAMDEEGNSLDTLLVETDSDDAIVVADFDMDRMRQYREREMAGNAMRRPTTYELLTTTEVRPPFIR